MKAGDLITKGEENRLRQVFEKSDLDGNGELDRAEIKTMVRKHYKLAGFSSMPFDREANAIFDELDKDRSGTVTMDEFIEAIFRSRKKAKLQALSNFF